MRSRLASAYLAVAAAAVLGFLLVPDGSLTQTQVACGWLGAAAIVAGVRRHRPAVPAACWLIAAGVAGNAAGIGVETILTRTMADPGFPSWAEAAYLSLYPFAAAGLILLVRRRSPQRNRSTIVDASTLKEAAAAWQHHLRTVDLLARYGGEEFVVLLPGATAEVAARILDRMREATPLGQTFSAGIALLADGEGSDELVARADAALYAAKRAGRDQVAVAGATELHPARTA
ncbi:diguanylate cyclase [Dactylosporangium sp. McL0621]|uniref:diguanylate cyclase n=1 Tax=Dactylosporangium sp. McL0621 TaxID=3415678 RepID=UPI003CF8BE53